MRIFVVEDEFVWLAGRRVTSRIVCTVSCCVQLVITLAAWGQHIYSLKCCHNILVCHFNSSVHTCLSNCTFSHYMAADIIIFDFGLFHELWGIPGCVAQELDGGYGRFLWCCCHLMAICTFMATTVLKHVQPVFLWPMLIQQSIYGVGLLILSLAGLPKLVPVIAEGRRNSWLLPSMVYTWGASFNFFLLYVFWHYYWFVEAEYRRLFPPPVENGANSKTGESRAMLVSTQMVPVQIDADDPDSSDIQCVQVTRI